MSAPRPNPPSRWPPPRCLVAATMLLVQAVVAIAAAPDAVLIAQGERIYRLGRLPSGEPLQGEALPGVVRSGADAACAACHRRSGYGMTEGTWPIRPITATALFHPEPAATDDPRIAHQLGPSRRAAYDDRTLTRAIREGVDVAGKPLARGMPRYAIDDGALRALLAYLKSLANESDPAVDAAEIHLATIIQPGVDPTRRSAMLAVLDAFVRDKNAATRWDEQRRQAGIMRMQRAYRRWNLHVWNLEGPPAGWGGQLEALYRRQPVFAIVGGLGDADWTPIQEFSERFSVPCIFPNAPLPGSGSHFYTVYLSGGVFLEAAVLARHLSTAGTPGPVTQVYRSGTPGQAAARALRAAVGATSAVEDRVLADVADPAFGRLLSGGGRSGPLVLWLDATDIDALSRRTDFGDGGPTLYLSSLLVGDPALAAPLAAAGADVRLSYPWHDQDAHRAADGRTRAWLARHGIAATGALATDTLFAATIVGDVLSHILDNFSRDYFVERVEHAVQQSLIPSSFPRVSLGPGQRFAAKGGYVVRVTADAGFSAVSDWIVP